MKILARGRSFIQNLFRRERVDGDLNEEVGAYVELLAQQKIKQGMSPEGAVRAARIELGGATQVQEEVRRARVGAGLQTIWQDLLYAGRVLSNNKTFTAVAVLTFSIGIGANTAIFSMVNGLLLRPVPVDRPGRLTYLIEKHESWRNSLPYQDFEEIRKQSADVFSDVAALRPFQMDGITVEGKSHPIWTGYVSTNFFPILGIQPAAGHFIAPTGNGLAGSDTVLVLSYSYWKAQFGGDPNIVGSKALLNGHPITIIGVAPEGFGGIIPIVETQGYLPIGVYAAMEGEKKDPVTERVSEMIVIARLRDGVDVGKSQPVLAVIAKRLADQYPVEEKDLVLRAVPWGSGFLHSANGPNPVLLIATLFLVLSGFVLLLASANVANLLLVRAIARNREMAVRSALGAARFRLIRQVLTETLLLALLGCAGGAALGYVGSRVLGGLNLHTELPVVLDFHMDWRVFAFALGAAVFVALMAGLVPAVRASRVDLADVLRE